MKTAILFVILIPSFLRAQTGTAVNVTQFGARGDGVTLNTAAIQHGIDSVSLKGGTLYFPPGSYLTGSLYLKSNVCIWIETGATILGSGNILDYDSHIPNLRSYNDAFLRYSLFYSEGEKNISIVGRGTIDGQGALFKVKTKKKPARYEDRPFIIRFVECKNVVVSGVTMKNSAMWMQQYLACDQLRIEGISVFNHANQNNDMMDIDGCKNVIISGCYGDTDDDGIVLKSTSEFPDENISVSNCVVSSHCNALKLGTESIGGFKNISISNIIVKPSIVDSAIFGCPGGISGITITEVDGGTLDGVSVSGVVMDGPRVPIFIRLGDVGRGVAGSQGKNAIGKLENVSIRDVLATNVKSIGCSITGLPGHPVKGITLSGIRITFAGGVLSDTSLGLPDELASHYPEGTMWGELPAYGFFVRHAEDISFSNVELRYRRRDERPPVYCDDVNGFKAAGISAELPSGRIEVFKLINVENAVITSSEPMRRYSR